MKLIGALLLTAFFSTAFAGGPTPQWPAIDFGGTQVAINNVCVSDNGFSTISPVRRCHKMNSTAAYACRMVGETSQNPERSPIPQEVCRKPAHNNDLRTGEYMRWNHECTETSDTILTTGRNGQRSECTSWSSESNPERNSECLKWEKKSYQIPTSYSVVLVQNGPERDGTYAGSMNFTIPACK